MRVLVITNDYPPKPGGIQQYLAGMVASLDAEVRVLAPAHPGAGSPDGVERGHRRFLWPTRRTRRWARDQVRAFVPDVVLFGAPYPLAQLGPWLRRRTGVPYAVLCHGAEITVPAAFPVTRQLVRYPLVRADGLLAVSHFTAGRVRRLTGRDVAVVGVGVDPAFAPAVDPPAAPVVGCVSRFVPRKGQARVLSAVAALRREGRDVSVLLVGTGRDETRLRRRAERLGVPTRFRVGVPFPDLPDAYRDMTVFAMPSRSRWLGLETEGLGIVYLEAAATGLPVVTGDSGGAPETVLPGVTGFVTATDRTLREALATLLDDPESARQMGAAGRRRISETFSWETVSRRFEAALRAAAAAGGGR